MQTQVSSYPQVSTARLYELLRGQLHAIEVRLDGYPSQVSNVSRLRMAQDLAAELGQRAQAAGQLSLL